MSSQSSPIAAVMMHITDWRAGLDWYQRAFPAAKRIDLPEFDFACLELEGIRLEVVRADQQVGSGAAGTVVYWWCADFSQRLQALQLLGATLFRGPLAIENGLMMAQLKDPWGNAFGIRGPA